MNTVVYYPHVWPRLKWLKVGALCWDKVYLLGPGVGAGYYVPIPEVENFVNALPEFVDIKTQVGDIVDDELAQRFQQWVMTRKQQLRAQVTDESQRLFGVYDEKFSHPIRTEQTLLSWLIEEGLARIEEPDRRNPKYHYDQEWGMFDSEIGASNFVSDTKVYLPKDIALHYLALAASKAAQDGNRDLAADQETFTDVVFYSARTARSIVASSVLEAYLPADLDRLEASRIADIRMELSAKRLEFQAATQQLVDEFLEVSSEGELANVQTSISALARERVERTQAIYRRAKLQTLVESVGVTLTPPALLTSVASALGIGVFGPAGIGAALSLFGAGILLKSLSARAERAQSPWSYVLDVSKMSRRS